MMGAAISAWGYGHELPTPAVRDAVPVPALISAIDLEDGRIGVREQRIQGARCFVIELRQSYRAPRFIRVMRTGARGAPDVVLGLATSAVSAASRWARKETAIEALDQLLIAGEFVPVEAVRAAAQPLCRRHPTARVM